MRGAMLASGLASEIWFGIECEWEGESKALTALDGVFDAILTRRPTWDDVGSKPHYIVKLEQVEQRGKLKKVDRGGVEWCLHAYSL